MIFAAMLAAHTHTHTHTHTHRYAGWTTAKGKQHAPDLVHLSGQRTVPCPLHHEHRDGGKDQCHTRQDGDIAGSGWAASADVSVLAKAAAAGVTQRSLVPLCAPFRGACSRDDTPVQQRRRVVLAPEAWVRVEVVTAVAQGIQRAREAS